MKKLDTPGADGDVRIRGKVLIENIYARDKLRKRQIKYWLIVIMFDFFFLSMLMFTFLIIIKGVDFFICITLFWTIVFGFLLYIILSLGTVEMLGKGPALYSEGILVYFVEGHKNIERFILFDDISSIIVTRSKPSRKMLAKLQVENEKKKEMKEKKKKAEWTEEKYKDSLIKKFNKTTRENIYIVTKTNEVLSLERKMLDDLERIVEVLQSNNVSIE